MVQTETEVVQYHPNFHKGIQKVIAKVWEKSSAYFHVKILEIFWTARLAMKFLQNRHTYKKKKSSKIVGLWETKGASYA